MKKLFTVLLIIATVSCKEQEQKKAPPKQVPFQPSVKQDIWHEQDGYHLRTYVITGANQVPAGSILMNPEQSYAPYTNNIKGSYEFIKSHKKHEYDTAFTFLRQQTDSVAMLKSLPMSDSIVLIFDDNLNY